MSPRVLARAPDIPVGTPDRVGSERNPIPISIVPLHTAVPGRARIQIGGLCGAPELALCSSGG